VDYLTTALELVGDDLDVPVLGVDGPLPESIAVVGLLGSTLNKDEKIPNGTEFPRALRALEQWSGIQIGGVAAAQIGGVTSMQALIVAHQTGLPLIDADFEGTATPRLEQLSLFGPGENRFTAAAVTSTGLTILVADATAEDLEDAWRGTVADTGGWAAFAIGPVSADNVRSRAIEGSLTRAVAIGRSVRAAKDLDEFAREHGGRVVATGRIREVERTGDALSFVHNDIVAVDSANGAILRIEAGSEYLLALIDGVPVASTPSVIALLDPLTRRSLAVDDLRVGTTVAAIVLPGAAWWWKEASRLARVSPRAYGMDFDAVDEATW
jgi:DUF917 family protein